MEMKPDEKFMNFSKPWLKLIERKEKLRAVATLTIHDASGMSPKLRRDVVRWLDKQTRTLLKNSAQLSNRYTSRFYILR